MPLRSTYSLETAGLRSATHRSSKPSQLGALRPSFGSCAELVSCETWNGSSFSREPTTSRRPSVLTPAATCPSRRTATDARSALADPNGPRTGFAAPSSVGISYSWCCSDPMKYGPAAEPIKFAGPYSRAWTLDSVQAVAPSARWTSTDSSVTDACPCTVAMSCAASRRHCSDPSRSAGLFSRTLRCCESSSVTPWPGPLP